MAHRDKVQRLIEAFPWGESGYPRRPPPGQETQLVHRWIDSELVPPFRRAATALIARIRPIVETVVVDECARAGERFVARIDVTHLTKSPAGVVEKMARRWDGMGAVPVSFGDVSSEFTDLARFRVVANFLSDAEAVRRALEFPYTTPHPPELSAEQRVLASEFRLRGNEFEDSIHVAVKLRHSAERCYKAVFEPRKAPSVHVEVQIHTLLQESWDKKEHVLAYEPTRRGEPLPHDVRLELEAMSDLLFVVDRTFDRVRAELQVRKA